MANQYTNLGNIYKTKGDLAAACAHWKTARGLFAEVGIPDKVAQVDELMQRAGCDTAA